MDQRLDGQFDEEKWLADKIVAAGHGGIGAAVKVIEAGDEHDRCFFVLGHGAQFGAQLEPVHVGHVHVEKNQVILVLAKQSQRLLRILDVDGFEPGLLQRINDGAAGNGLVVHHQDFGGGKFLAVRQGALFEQEPEKIHRRRNRAGGGGIDVLRFLVHLLEQGLEGGGHVGDLRQAREAGIAIERMHLAVKLIDLLQPGHFRCPP